VGFSIVGLEVKGAAIAGDRLVQPSLVFERIAEIVVRLGIVRLES